MIPSEAHLDHPRDLVRVQLRGPAFTGNLGGLRGVDLVRGEAQNGVSRTVVERLRGIGFDLVILGPWEAPEAPPVSPPAPTPAHRESAPQTTAAVAPPKPPAAAVAPPRRKP